LKSAAIENSSTAQSEEVEIFSGQSSAENESPTGVQTNSNSAAAPIRAAELRADFAD
jgi:hypothetical protein